MADLTEKIISSARTAAAAAETAASAVQSSAVNVGSAGRVLSLASGAMLLGYGIYRRGARGYGAMLIGAALCDRGVRGHCAVNAALGRNTATNERTHGEIEAEEKGDGHLVEYSVTIERPLQELYGRLCQESELRQVLGLAAGADSNGASSRNGNEPSAIEITDREENHRIDWKSGEGLAGSILLAAAPGNRGTEITAFLEIEPAHDVLGRAIAWLSQVGAGASLRKGLRQLKQRLEAGEIPVTDGQPAGRSGSKRTEREPMVLAEI